MDVRLFIETGDRGLDLPLWAHQDLVAQFGFLT